jgi:hypothetical protein
MKRALVFLMTARYIPFGRTAVNLVAGAVHYPHRHFWPRSLLSTFVWAVYSCAIGAVAGAWFEDNHLLAITVALVAAVAMALIVERLIAAVHRRLDRRAERRKGPTETLEEAEARAAEAEEVEVRPAASDLASTAAATDIAVEDLPAAAEAAPRREDPPLAPADADEPARRLATTPQGEESPS